MLVASGIALAPFAAAHGAGALAIGPCGAHGYAYDFGEEQAARTTALRRCSGDGKG